MKTTNIPIREPRENIWGWRAAAKAKLDAQEDELLQAALDNAIELRPARKSDMIRSAAMQRTADYRYDNDAAAERAAKIDATISLVPREVLWDKQNPKNLRKIRKSNQKESAPVAGSLPMAKSLKRKKRK